MFALQEVRRTYQERGVQRVWEKIIGMHVQMKTIGNRQEAYS